MTTEGFKPPSPLDNIEARFSSFGNEVKDNPKRNKKSGLLDEIKTAVHILGKKIRLMNKAASETDTLQANLKDIRTEIRKLNDMSMPEQNEEKLKLRAKLIKIDKQIHELYNSTKGSKAHHLLKREGVSLSKILRDWEKQSKALKKELTIGSVEKKSPGILTEKTAIDAYNEIQQVVSTKSRQERALEVALQITGFGNLNKDLSELYTTNLDQLAEIIDAAKQSPILHEEAKAAYEILLIDLSVQMPKAYKKYVFNKIIARIEEKFTITPDIKKEILKKLNAEISFLNPSSTFEFDEYISNLLNNLSDSNRLTFTELNANILTKANANILQELHEESDTQQHIPADSAVSQPLGVRNEPPQAFLGGHRSKSNVSGATEDGLVQTAPATGYSRPPSEVNVPAQAEQPATEMEPPRPKSDIAAVELNVDPDLHNYVIAHMKMKGLDTTNKEIVAKTIEERVTWLSDQLNMGAIKGDFGVGPITKDIIDVQFASGVALYEKHWQDPNIPQEQTASKANAFFDALANDPRLIVKEQNSLHAPIISDIKTILANTPLTPKQRFVLLKMLDNEKFNNEMINFLKSNGAAKIPEFVFNDVKTGITTIIFKEEFNSMIASLKTQLEAVNNNSLVMQKYSELTQRLQSNYMQQQSANEDTTKTINDAKLAFLQLATVANLSNLEVDSVRADLIQRVHVSLSGAPMTDMQRLVLLKALENPEFVKNLQIHLNGLGEESLERLPFETEVEKKAFEMDFKQMIKSLEPEFDKQKGTHRKERLELFSSRQRNLLQNVNGIQRDNDSSDSNDVKELLLNLGVHASQFEKDIGRTEIITINGNKYDFKKGANREKVIADLKKAADVYIDLVTQLISQATLSIPLIQTTKFLNPNSDTLLIFSGQSQEWNIVARDGLATITAAAIGYIMNANEEIGAMSNAIEITIDFNKLDKKQWTTNIKTLFEQVADVSKQANTLKESLKLKYSSNGFSFSKEVYSEVVQLRKNKKKWKKLNEDTKNEIISFIKSFEKLNNTINILIPDNAISVTTYTTPMQYTLETAKDTLHQTLNSAT